MYIRRKVFSVAYDETTGEERMFSTTEIISEENYLQKEFNSKAAKALNNKYLKQVAAKKGIPVYESKGFRTVEVDPKKWKHNARFQEQTTAPKKDYFNRNISERSPRNTASGSRTGEGFGHNRNKSYKKINLAEYDHGIDRDYLKYKNTRKFDLERAKESRLANKN